MTCSNLASFPKLTYIFICNEKPILPHELSDSDDACRYHSTQEDDEDTTEIGQTELSVVVGCATLEKLKVEVEKHHFFKFR